MFGLPAGIKKTSPPDDLVITTATATDNVVWPTGPTGFTDDGSWTIKVADKARRPGKSE